MLAAGRQAPPEAERGVAAAAPRRVCPPRPGAAAGRAAVWPTWLQQDVPHACRGDIQRCNSDPAAGKLTIQHVRTRN